MKELDEYYTVSDVQHILKIGRRKAYKLVNQPDFPKVRIGHDIRIPKSTFEDFMTHILYTNYEL